MYTLARQGLDASTILGDGVNGAINVVNDLAQATDSSMTDTATVITDVVHEYGLSGSALRDVANTMSGALHNSSESLDDFYQSMKQVGPVASAMHQNALDVSTALALLAQHGITGSSAGTALKNMLLGLSPRTKAAAADFAKLGISVKNGATNSFFDLQGNLKPLPDIINLLNEKFNGLSDAQKQAALSTVFTKYGLAGLNTIVGESRDKFLAFQDELRKDDAATIAAKKMDNLHGDLLKFNAGVQTMMKSFGDSINGMLRPIVQGASEAIKWITQLPKPVKEMGMAFLGIGSTLAIAGGSVIAFAGGVKMLGPALEMAGISTAGLEAAAGTLGAIFSEVLIPIAAVVAIVAAVALGFKLAYDHIKPFHDAVNNVINTVKQLGTALKGMWQGGSGEGKGISILDNLGFSPNAIKAVQNTINTIKSGLHDIGQAFNHVKIFAKGIIDIFNGKTGTGFSLLSFLGFSPQTIAQIIQISDQIHQSFNDIKKTVTTTINEVWDVIKNVFGQIMDFWNKNHNQIDQTAGKVWKDIGDFIKQAISFIVPIIQHFTSEVLPIISKVFKDVCSFAVEVFKGFVSYIGDGIKTISAWWKQYWPEIKQLFHEVWSAMKAFLGPILGAIKTAIDAALGFIKGSWKNGWNAIKDVLKAVWDVIKGAIKTAWDAISGIISTGLDILTGHWGKAWNDIKSTFSKVWDDIRGMFGNLINDAIDFGKNIVEGIANGIKGAIGAVTSAIGNVVSSIKGFFTGGGGGSVNVSVTPHAVGGIFSTPHLGLVAEAGPEAIIPLSDPSRGLALWKQAGQALGVMPQQSNSFALPSSSGSMSQPVFNVYVSGNIARSEKELGDIVSRAIFEKAKMQGRF